MPSLRNHLAIERVVVSPCRRAGILRLDRQDRQLVDAVGPYGGDSGGAAVELLQPAPDGDLPDRRGADEDLVGRASDQGADVSVQRLVLPVPTKGRRGCRAVGSLLLAAERLPGVGPGQAGAGNERGVSHTSGIQFFVLDADPRHMRRHG